LAPSTPEASEVVAALGVDATSLLPPEHALRARMKPTLAPTVTFEKILFIKISFVKFNKLF
jgi:hypothetical protein